MYVIKNVCDMHIYYIIYAYIYYDYIYIYNIYDTLSYLHTLKKHKKEKGVSCTKIILIVHQLIYLLITSLLLLVH